MKYHGAGTADWFMGIAAISDSVKLGVDVAIVAGGGGLGRWGKQASNRIPAEYPKSIDLKNGREIPFPDGALKKLPVSSRAPRDPEIGKTSLDLGMTTGWTRPREVGDFTTSTT